MQTKEKQYFKYEGPVYHFEKYVDNFKGNTWAVSRKQAANNILFQFKTSRGWDPRCGGYKLDLRYLQ